MGTIKLPKYVRPKKRAGKIIGYYWELPTWAKAPKDNPKARPLRNGKPCPVESTPLGSRWAVAEPLAESLNEAFESWRKGVEHTATKGTVRWLFEWYREQERYKSKAAKTRSDYRKLMDMMADYPMRAGNFGERSAAKVDGEVADKLYAKLKSKGERQATYAMQVCRLVWTWAVRHSTTTGVTVNPFLKMGLASRPKKGNRATSREEYTLYRETARELGYQSMAVAAALTFELCQRVWDVFGFLDDDGEKARGIVWSGYHPGDKVVLTQSKTGQPVEIPLTIAFDDGDVVPLYPELEAELRITPKKGVLIVVEERNGLPYTERRMSSVHREICEKAGLPKDMTFTGFRHGGITEIGDAGEADVRPISRHLTLQTTQIYNKLTVEKARRIGLARREHIARAAPDLSERVSERMSERKPKSAAK